MRVIDGAIFEKRFRLVEEASSRLVCTAHEVYTPNQLAFIHDVMGLHQIGCHNYHTTYWNNHGLVASQPAVSLHLYTPPIRHCHVYSSSVARGEEAPTVQVRDSGPMPHYSEYGRKCPTQ
jgi:Cysteine dioxygenase type I